MVVHANLSRAAFVGWALLFSVIVFGDWLALQIPVENDSYIPFWILLLGAFLLFIAFLGVLIAGLVSQKFMGTLGAALTGLLIGFVLISIGKQIKNYPAAVELHKQHTELSALAKAVRSGDRTEIARRANNLHKLSIPFVTCIFASPPDMGFTKLRDEPGHADDFRLSTPQVMLFADVLATSAAPDNQKEAALYSVLEMLAQRERLHIDTYPQWIAIWKKAHGNLPLKYMTMDRHSATTDTLCRTGESDALFDIPLNAWGDAAVKAWLDGGLVFAPKQHRAVLAVITRASTLAAAIHAGVDVNAVSKSNPQSAFMPELAASLTGRLDHAEAPEEIALLVEEFVHQGVDLHAKGTADENYPCATFEIGEQASRSLGQEISTHLAARARAVDRIQKALCNSVAAKK